MSETRAPNCQEYSYKWDTFFFQIDLFSSKTPWVVKWGMIRSSVLIQSAACKGLSINVCIPEAPAFLLGTWRYVGQVWYSLFLYQDGSHPCWQSPLGSGKWARKWEVPTQHIWPSSWGWAFWDCQGHSMIFSQSGNHFCGPWLCILLPIH